jgi:hypothetical protein
VTAGIPLIFSLFLAWFVPPFTSQPFPSQTTPELRRADYKLVATCLYSEATFTASGAEFWHALTRSSRRQARLLTWYYISVIGEGMLFGVLVRRYGKMRRNRLYSKLADNLLLPNVSEWHVLLTPLVFPDRKATVKADVLFADGNLYQGTVSQYFIDRDGMLSGLILTEPRRFDRRTYLQDKDQGKDQGKKPDPNVYWKGIPSAKLYMFANKITNINLNYEPTIPSQMAVSELVKEKTGKDVSVSITFSKPNDTLSL